MSTVICNFMGDPSLEQVANNLCKLKRNQFTHIFSHRRPSQKSHLAALDFIDATLLYRHHNLKKAFSDLTISSISLKQSYHLIECQSLFLLATDRTTPIPDSVHSKVRFFWDLVGYFISFFKKNKNIDSILFDNIPHIPWDICLFYVAKMLDKKVLVLRKTGMRGYIYIDEDFRPGKTKLHFDYKGLSNPLDKFVNKDNFIAELNDLSFTKGQVNGMWPKEPGFKKNPMRNVLDVFRQYGFQKLITLGRIFILGAPNNYKCATEYSAQRTTLAGMKPVGRWQFFKIHNSYLKNIKYCAESYDKLVLNDIDLESPFIYLSLHFQPERTTLPEGLIYDDQILVVRTLAAALPEGWKLIVKEHPRQMKYDLRSIHARSPIDYERISEIPNVYIVSSAIDQKLLINKCRFTATISGSVSWEGLLVGKPSLIFSQNWHERCKSTRFVASVEDVKHAVNELQKKSRKEVECDICSFVRSISGSLINAALNKNHLRMFFTEENKHISIDNMTSAILQRLNLT